MKPNQKTRNNNWSKNIKTYTADKAILAWNPNSNQVKIGPLLDSWSKDWTEPYLMTGLGAYEAIRRMSFEERTLYVMAEFKRLVVDYKVSPAALHKEMCKLEEYQRQTENWL